MSKIFVTPEIAERLKALGFDEPSIAYYTFATQKLKGSFIGNGSGEFEFVQLKNIYKDYSLAPTYDQVVQWFIDYHDMYVTVVINPDLYLSRINYSADIRSLAMEKEGLRLADGFTVYQDRHLALIEGIEEALNLIEKE